MAVTITAAEASTSDGTVVATITRVPTGGGIGGVFTPAGVHEFVTHPVGETFHVRCLSPDSTIPDQLLEAADYDAAAALAEAYVAKREQHAATVASLADDLKV